jgi:ubiquinone/menaquinone biosynthesis C-methylase UbiE
MTQTYKFDDFQENRKKSEINRLTMNVESHSKILCEYFLNNGLISSKNVLDVGCGTGAMLNMFADILPGTEFIGIDNSKEILESANKTIKPNINFFRGEGFCLPFKNSSFDFVYTRLVLMHNKNPENIIHEMKRVCRPGGIIVSVEIDDGTILLYPFADEFSCLIRAYIEYSKICGMDRIIGRKLFSIYKSEGMKEVKAITQTSDYDGPYFDIPISLQMAIGSDNANYLVEAKLITEEQRSDYMYKLKIYRDDPNRYFTGSFIYCIGKK